MKLGPKTRGFLEKVQKKQPKKKQKAVLSVDFRNLIKDRELPVFGLSTFGDGEDKVKVDTVLVDL